jgi:uncharacterized protein (DUF1800 family)
MKRFSLLAWMLTLPLAAAAKELPYHQAGLNSYQAAAHLLSRFSYGPTPGQVEKVVHQGLDSWLESQLSGRLDDTLCDKRLQAYPALAMDNEQIQQTYLAGPQLRRMASQAGKVDTQGGDDQQDMKMRRQIAAFAQKEGLKTERELLRQGLAQKVTRCVYSENQLREIMTDFWFNHFNVSRTTNPARPHILSYERDVIRPQALGDFRSLLGSTARHPAMLLYLNNAQSMANAEAPRLSKVSLPGFQAKAKANAKGKRPVGLNENYARELMELHTLGVDGGYSQKDVTEVARVLTGWTTAPRGPAAQRFSRLVEQYPDQVEPGSYGFLFVPFLHDAGPKTVMGKSFPAGQGMAEGDRLLDMLADDPHTCQRVARKFAVRFISDEPDPKVVLHLAQVYRRSHGNSAALIRAIAESQAFWSASALRAKVKNPLEYTVSSVRVMGGELRANETDLPQWVEKMGQAMYGCVPPTGYPDRSEQWISSGTLVHRVNFAFALATGRVRGVRIDLPAGPVEKVAQRILPGRPLDKALEPVRQTMSNEKFFSTVRPNLPGDEMAPQKAAVPLSESQKVSGVLLSCPEFQRR